MEISAKELAQLINVSPATVSMVFNNKPGISEATRELVMRTAAQYGYTGKSTQTAAASRVIQLINYKKHGKIAAEDVYKRQVLFGLMHNALYLLAGLQVGLWYHMLMFLFTGMAALLLGWLNEKIFNGSILPGILLHGAGNFINSMLMAFSLM